MGMKKSVFNVGHKQSSLFNGISTLFRLFNAKAILLEEQYKQSSSAQVESEVSKQEYHFFKYFSF